MSGLRVALIGLCCSIAVASIRAADLGVARHVDAGYDEAKSFAKEKGIKIPMEK